MANRILFVNKRPGLIEEFVTAMKQFNFVVDAVLNGSQALLLLEREEYKVVVTGLIMDETDGIQLISKINQDYPSIACVVLTTKLNVAQLAYLVNQLEVYRIYLRPVDLKGQFAEMIVDALAYYDHRKHYFQKQLVLQSSVGTGEKKAAQMSAIVENAKHSSKLMEQMVSLIMDFSGEEFRGLKDELLKKRGYFIQKLVHQFLEIERKELGSVEDLFQQLQVFTNQFEYGSLKTDRTGTKEYSKIVYQKMLYIGWVLLLRASSTKQPYRIHVYCNTQDSHKIQFTYSIQIDRSIWDLLDQSKLGAQMIEVAETFLESITKTFSIQKESDSILYLVEVWNEE